MVLALRSTSPSDIIVLLPAESILPGDSDVVAPTGSFVMAWCAQEVKARVTAIRDGAPKRRAIEMLIPAPLRRSSRSPPPTSSAAHTSPKSPRYHRGTRKSSFKDGRPRPGRQSLSAMRQSTRSARKYSTRAFSPLLPGHKQVKLCHTSSLTHGSVRFAATIRSRRS